MQISGLELSSAALALGAINGAAYGLLAVGLILVYRSDRVLNFAHADTGVVGATVMTVAVVRWDVPYWLAFPLGLLTGAAAACIVQLGVVGRLRRAPPLVVLIATLGFAQFLSLLAASIGAGLPPGSSLPEPPLLPGFEIGVLVVTPSATAVLLLAPVIVGALAVFLARTRTGLSLRAAADAPGAGRTIGIHPFRMSALAWGISGTLSAFTAVLAGAASDAGAGPPVFGVTLLLRALAAAAVGRLRRLPDALAAGVVIGVVEQVVVWNEGSAGSVDLVIGALLVVVLVLVPAQHARPGTDGHSWVTLASTVPARRDRLSDAGPWVAAGLTAVVALVAGLVTSAATSIALAAVAGTAVVGLSVGLLSGVTGQLSLGQFALAGIAAAVSAHVTRRTGNYVAAFTAAAVVAAAISVALGAVAVRARGLALTVSTLVLAAVTHAWLLPQSWALGEGLAPGRPIIGGFALDTSRRYYWFAALVLVSAVLTSGFVRRRWGTIFAAVRDNEEAARAFGVRASLRKLQALAIGGALAGVGGATYGHGFSLLTPDAFPPLASVEVLAMAATGGLTATAGPVIGALYIRGLPALVDLDAAGLAATAFGWLVLVLYLPRGIAGLFGPVRERLVVAAGERPAPMPRVHAPATPSAPPPTLVAENLTKTFGSVVAVDGVSFSVAGGDIVGVIGPNGAGKSTLFDLLSGFAVPDGGGVVVGDVEVTRASPERRARMGLVRGFQHPVLFPTLTVLDAVSVAGGRRPEEAPRTTLSLLGIDELRHTPVHALSTGQRRLAELACLAARRPRVLLLDEPSAGLAQREAESLARLLLDLRVALDATLLIVEHDFALIRSVADRLLAIAQGRLIAEGAPAAVLADPQVVDAYYGRTAGVA